MENITDCDKKELRFYKSASKQVVAFLNTTLPVSDEDKDNVAKEPKSPSKKRSHKLSIFKIHDTKKKTKYLIEELSKKYLDSDSKDKKNNFTSLQKSRNMKNIDKSTNKTRFEINKNDETSGKEITKRTYDDNKEKRKKRRNKYTERIYLENKKNKSLKGKNTKK